MPLADLDRYPEYEAILDALADAVQELDHPDARAELKRRLVLVVNALTVQTVRLSGVEHPKP